MASVLPVSNTEFRASLFQQQNEVPEHEAPFSQLLNTVTDVKATAQRPEAPKIERRPDAPVKQPKQEAGADRQAKRQTKDATKPDAKPQPDAAAPAKASESDSGPKETKSADTDTDTDALMLIALTTAPQEAAPQTAVDAPAALQAPVAPTAETAPEASPVPAAAPVAAIEAAKPEAAAQVVAAAETPVAKPKAEIAPANAQADSEAQFALPKTDADAIKSAIKPVHAAATAEVQAPGQQTNAPAANGAPLHAPAHLEMLNAAISKHAQLAAGLEASEPAADAPKPLISSNAVAPNFALTAQANAPVPTQAQTAVESARSVPVDQLAVEIATRAGKGERRFDIRLDPPELGRIDVRLEIDSKGNTTTKLIVERSETLDMLKQDARGLERALQNAGLKTDAGGLQFSLQQDAQTHQGNQNRAPEMRGGRPDIVPVDAEASTPVAIRDASLAAQLRGGVDIRI